MKIKSKKGKHICYFYSFLYIVKKKSNFFFYNNYGIHAVIIYFTVSLCITKMKKVIFQRRFICLFLFGFKKFLGSNFSGADSFACSFMVLRIF